MVSGTVGLSCSCMKLGRDIDGYFCATNADQFTVPILFPFDNFATLIFMDDSVAM